MGLTVVRLGDRVPEFVCRVCHIPFYEDERRAYEAHVVQCSNRHEAMLLEMSPARRLPGILGDEGTDTELEAWARHHGAAILEGRKRM